MLSDERDLRRMRDGVERLFAVSRHKAIQDIVTDIHIDGSGRHIEDLSSEALLDKWMLAQCGDAQHGVGSCRMGAVSDPRTVVDSDCRVLGVAGLRVIDASIMPNIPRACTHLTCVMIGEHMANRLQ